MPSTEYAFTTLLERGISMFKKAMSAVVSLCLLAGGGFFSSEGHRLTVSLFIHYLQGSGEAVTLKLPSFLDKYCQEEGVVSVYTTDYEYAFGNFTCKESGGYDLYDFSYESNAGICQRIPSRLTNPRTWKSQRRMKRLLAEMPVNTGRCLVGLGYGEPFEVHITK